MRIARHAGNAVYFPQVMYAQRLGSNPRARHNWPAGLSHRVLEFRAAHRLLEVSSLIMTGWLGAGSFVAFIQLQMIEVLINIFRRILIEPPKGKLLSKHPRPPRTSGNIRGSASTGCCRRASCG